MSLKNKIDLKVTKCKLESSTSDFKKMTIDVDINDRVKLKMLAAKQRCSMSDIVRELIKEYISK
jgi:hypothetical protein